ncbi:MAG: nucleoside triphosphate pyrophosphohydrolase [Clostridiales bacterium]|jgi:tetrapyrrole methylase family protein/MazG family protein|nr:nucleoside triphosphate pyrophosphohydrolase [Clostridiales bacterium]
MTDDFLPKSSYNIDDLVSIMSRLRAPGGCPWDAEQTHESIKKNLIEETYEVIEAINKGDSALLLEELGDLLLQVVFHARLEEETGRFSFDDVCDGICKKLIERHPHVFGDIIVDSVGDVLANWDSIKRRSKGQKKGSETMLSVPRELPALMRASKVQQRAARLGFDWPDVSGASEKLSEEQGELLDAVASGDKDLCAEELGDLLFSAVNVSRFVGCDAEEALTGATDKFIARFQKLERLAKERGIDLEKSSLAEMDKLWDEIKHK